MKRFFHDARQLAAILILGATPSALSPASPLPSSATSAWHQVCKVQGTSSKETESFEIASNEWRITWSSKPMAAASYFSITVYDPSGKPVSLVANTANGGMDTSYIRGRKGKYYLKIAAANIAYGIVVEDQR